MRTDAPATRNTAPAAHPDTPVDPVDPVAFIKLGLQMLLSLVWWWAGVMQGRGGWMLNLLFVAGLGILLYRLTLVGALVQSGGSPIPRLWLSLLLPFTPFAPPPTPQPDPSAPPAATTDWLHAPYWALGMVALGLAFWLSWEGGLSGWMGHAFLDLWDEQSRQYLGDGLKTASVILITGELLHGLLSVIEHLTLTLAPFGFGFEVSIGQIVAPIDDVLVRFNDIMIAATASLGIQQLLLALAQKTVFALVIPLAVALWLISLLPSTSTRFLRQLALKLVVVGIFVRLAIPAIAQVGILADHLVLQNDQHQTVQELHTLAAQVDQDSQTFTATMNTLDDTPPPAPPATQPATPEEGGRWDKLKDSISSHLDATVISLKRAAEALSPTHYLNWAKQKKTNVWQYMQGQYAGLKLKMEAIKDKMLHLIVITLVQVIVLPLLTLWLMKLLFAWMVGGENYARFEAGLQRRKTEVDQMRERLWQRAAGG